MFSPSLPRRASQPLLRGRSRCDFAVAPRGKAAAIVPSSTPLVAPLWDGLDRATCSRPGGVGWTFLKRGLAPLRSAPGRTGARVASQRCLR
ncbi:hypothetical protein T484DRAFT_1964612 [Baffinella frigidus]|nr:hypothetical protein T484DRAFT_1964612 [Cryptophyta sp. CCMP2293]